MNYKFNSKKLYIPFLSKYLYECFPPKAIYFGIGPSNSINSAEMEVYL